MFSELRVSYAITLLVYTTNELFSNKLYLCALREPGFPSCTVRDYGVLWGIMYSGALCTTGTMGYHQMGYYGVLVRWDDMYCHDALLGTSYCGVLCTGGTMRYYGQV